MRNRLIRIGEKTWLRASDIISIEMREATLVVNFQDGKGDTQYYAVQNSTLAKAEAIAAEINEVYMEAY